MREILAYRRVLRNVQVGEGVLCRLWTSRHHQHLPRVSEMLSCRRRMKKEIVIVEVMREHFSTVANEIRIV